MCQGQRVSQLFPSSHRCRRHKNKDSIFAAYFQEVHAMANKEQKKAPKVAPKSNKQKKQMQKEKKAAKSNTSGITLKKESNP